MHSDYTKTDFCIYSKFKAITDGPGRSPHLASCVIVCVSPTLSPASLPLSPPLSPCLSVSLQEEKGISCALVDLDFLKCSVGFPFMRAQTKVPHTKTNMECMQCSTHTPH